MVPKHNDDPYSDDDEEEEQLPAQTAPKAAKLRRPADTVGVKMPLKLSSSLTSESCHFWGNVPLQKLEQGYTPKKLSLDRLLLKIIFLWGT